MNKYIKIGLGLVILIAIIVAIIQVGKNVKPDQTELKSMQVSQQQEIASEQSLNKTDAITSASEMQNNAGATDERNQGLALLLSVILAILLAIAIIYILRKRTIMLESTSALVPEKWASYLSDTVNASQTLESKTLVTFEGYANSLKNYEEKLKYSQDNISALTKEIKKLSDLIITFSESIDAKDREIDRLKKGYDQKIYNNFLKRVLSLYLSINEDSSIKPDYGEGKSINNLIKLFQGFFEEFGVEEFEPVLHSDYTKSASIIRNNPLIIETNIPEDHLKVAKVIKKGFRLKNTEEEIILIPAEVSIFKFIEEE